jgi:hypothetical protein
MARIADSAGIAHGVRRNRIDWDPKFVQNAQATGGMLGETALQSQPILGNMMQGAAMAGPMGALGGLLASSEQFGVLMGSVNDVFQMLADTVGALLVPLFPLVESLSGVAQIVIESVSPILQMLAEGLSFFAPILAMVGEMLKPIIQILQTIWMPVFTGLAYVMKAVAVILGAIMLGIGHAWNAILDTINFLIGWIHEDIRNTISGARMDTEGMTRTFRSLWDMQIDEAKAVSTASYENAKAQQQAAGAARELADTLQTLNSPSGFKRAQYAFDAMDAGQKNLSFRNGGLY